jgi:preprotein translocase subunit SecE
MKKQTKKKKKKAIRKKIRSRSRPQVISKSDSGSIAEEKVKRPLQAVSKREHEKRGGDKVSIIRYLNVAVQFLRECKIELKKVKWPTRKEMLASTSMVIFLVLAIAFFLGLIDFGLIKIIKKILN